MATELERWLDALRELLAAPNGAEAFLAILRYILLVNETPPERLRDLTHAPGPKAEEAYMTGAQILLEQGRREGEAKGRTEGEAKGKAEGILGVLAARKVAITDVEMYTHSHLHRSPSARPLARARRDRGLHERRVC